MEVLNGGAWGLHQNLVLAAHIGGKLGRTSGAVSKSRSQRISAALSAMGATFSKLLLTIVACSGVIRKFLPLWVGRVFCLLIDQSDWRECENRSVLSATIYEPKRNICAGNGAATSSS